MLNLGDIVIPITHKFDPQRESDVTIEQIVKVYNNYLYKVSCYPWLFAEEDLRLIRTSDLQPQYHIGDTIITDKHKDTCIRNGITNEVVPGTIDAMEAIVKGVFLTPNGDIAYMYYVDTPKGTFEGSIEQSDMPKHQCYSIF